MAVLSNADRAAAWSEFMRAPECPGGIVKADLRAAIDAADNWVEANSAAYNTALPVAARNSLTAKQKASLLMYVVSRRFGVA